MLPSASTYLKAASAVFIAMLLTCTTARVALAATSEMRNPLNFTGEGHANSAYNKRIKNLLVFQAGGWGGLQAEAAAGLVNPTWPLDGGQAGYMRRTHARLVTQMTQIRGLGDHVAVAQLIMPPQEAVVAQYGTCWNGTWISSMSCGSGGVWTQPREMLSEVKLAAWLKGLQVAPFFSINNYDCNSCNDRGARTLARLQQLTDWYVDNLVDLTSVRTVDGRLVILVEGIPEFTGLIDATAKQAVIDYMNGRSDIFWIDNLANGNPSQYGDHVYRSAATFDITGTIQDGLKASWGVRYLWHFLDRYGRDKDRWAEDQKIPEDVRMKWLNIDPHEPDRYPVIISQWNEYAEFHVFEPNEFDGWLVYDYLRWRMTQQP